MVINGDLMGCFMVMSWRFNQQTTGMLVDIPGLVNRQKNYGKSPCYSWENSLFRLGHFQQLCSKLPEGKPPVYREIQQLPTAMFDSRIATVIIILLDMLQPTCSSSASSQDHPSSFEEIVNSNTKRSTQKSNLGILLVAS